MRLRTRLVAQQLVVLGALVGACADTGDPVAGSHESGATEASESASSSCDRACRVAQRRADQKARDAERCRELRSEVHLRYRFTATPVAAGREIGLHLTVVNRSDALVSGSTEGLLAVDSGGGGQPISWGGSSADELYQDPGTVTTDEVFGRMPGRRLVGRRVTTFDFSTYLYPPGRGTVACFMPAHVVAPPGLVVGHPSGIWKQRSSRPF